MSWSKVVDKNGRDFTQSAEDQWYFVGSGMVHGPVRALINAALAVS